MLQLTAAQINRVKATAPVLAEQGAAITQHFYRRMFAKHPDLKNIFNQTNQKSGVQAETLARAVWAYAANIDNLAALGPAVAHIANKHASLHIQPAHYEIVGEHLLAAIVEVLGEAVDGETIEAWTAAYGQLAGIMIGGERDLYGAADWQGFRPFTVIRKVRESSEITSFYLAPVDSEALGVFLPGQYVSVKRYIEAFGYEQPRQYSLSDAPHPDRLRISVKREPGRRPEIEPGVMSNALHEGVEVGDIVQVSAPSGVFTLDTRADSPVVLVSGGVGITPMISMLAALIQHRSTRPVLFAHACRDAASHAFKAWVERSAEAHDNIAKHVCYETVGDGSDGSHGKVHSSAGDPVNGDGDGSGGRGGYDAIGRLDLSSLLDPARVASADFYLCGPLPFMIAQKESLSRLGVAATRIHTEVFGSGMLG
jgi:nitric oxide dioxygenase